MQHGNSANIYAGLLKVFQSFPKHFAFPLTHDIYKVDHIHLLIYAQVYKQEMTGINLVMKRKRCRWLEGYEIYDGILKGGWSCRRCSQP